MRRRAAKALLLVLLFLAGCSAFAVPVCAEEGSADRAQGERAQEEAEAAAAEDDEAAFGEEWFSALRELLPPGYGADPADTGAVSEMFGARAVLSDILAMLAGERGDILSFFALCVGAAILLTAGSCIGGMAPESAPALSSAIGQGISAVCAGAVFAFMRGESRAVEECLAEAGKLFGGLVPLFCGITAAGGGGGTAAAESAAMSFTLGLTTGVLTRFLLPLCSVLFAFALVGTVGEDTPLPRLTACARSVFLWGLGAVCTVTTACFSLQKAVTAAADSMAMRGAKYAISGLIPMVGSTVSGSLATLAAGLSYVKGTVGALSLGAVAYIMLPSLLRLLLFRCALSVGGGICGALGGKEHFFAPFRAALDTLIAVYVSALLLYGAQIVLFMQCGVTVG